MRRVVACLVVLAVAALGAACGPDQPQPDWSKYSAPSAVQGGEQPVD